MLTDLNLRKTGTNDITLSIDDTIYMNFKINNIHIFMDLFSFRNQNLLEIVRLSIVEIIIAFEKTHTNTTIP